MPFDPTEPDSTETAAPAEPEKKERKSRAEDLSHEKIKKWIREAQKTKVRRRVKDADTPSLELRIGTMGKAMWWTVCADRVGHTVHHSLDYFSDINGIQVARDKNLRARADIRAGIDPNQRLKEQKELRLLEYMTLDKALVIHSKSDTVLGTGETKAGAQRSWTARERRARGVFARLLQRPLIRATLEEYDKAVAARAKTAKASADMARGAVAAALRTIADDDEQPTKLRNHCRELAKMALVKGAAGKKRTRFLSEDELRKLIPSLRRHEEKDDFFELFEGLLLGGRRPTELSHGKWEDYEPEDGVLILRVLKQTNPKKPKKPFPAPISRQFAATLERLRAKAIAKRGKAEGLILRNRGDGRLGRRDRATEKARIAAGTPLVKETWWQVRDFRRTAATIASMCGYYDPEIGALLNHEDSIALLQSGTQEQQALAAKKAAKEWKKLSALTVSIYNQNQISPFLRSRLAAMVQDIADAIDDVVAGRSYPEVAEKYQRKNGREGYQWHVPDIDDDDDDD